MISITDRIINQQKIQGMDRASATLAITGTNWLSTLLITLSVWKTEHGVHPPLFVKVRKHPCFSLSIVCTRALFHSIFLVHISRCICWYDGKTNRHGLSRLLTVWLSYPTIFKETQRWFTDVINLSYILTSLVHLGLEPHACVRSVPRHKDKVTSRGTEAQWSTCATLCKVRCTDSISQHSSSCQVLCSGVAPSRFGVLKNATRFSRPRRRL